MFGGDIDHIVSSLASDVDAGHVQWLSIGLTPNRIGEQLAKLL
jgi:hypothetical protein